MNQFMTTRWKQGYGKGWFAKRITELKAHMRQHALAWEIGLILVLKLVVIIAIKDSYFSEPVPRVQVKQAMQQLWQADQTQGVVQDDGQNIVESAAK